MARNSKLVHVTFAAELLQALDSYAQKGYLNRCEFIRQAVVEKIRTLQPSPPTPAERRPAVDLLMTDKQLEDLRFALTVEWRRRRQARLPPSNYQ